MTLMASRQLIVSISRYKMLLPCISVHKKITTGTHKTVLFGEAELMMQKLLAHVIASLLLHFSTLGLRSNKNHFISTNSHKVGFLLTSVFVYMRNKYLNGRGRILKLVSFFSPIAWNKFRWLFFLHKLLFCASYMGRVSNRYFWATYLVK